METGAISLLKSLAPLIVSQLPLAGVLLAPDWLKGYVTNHPFKSVLFFVLYELLVTISIKVYKKLEDDIVLSIANAAKRAFGAFSLFLINLFSRYRKKYLRDIVFDNRSIKLTGLRTTGAFSLRLDQIFIELRIAPRAANQVTSSVLSPAGSSGFREIWDYLRQGAKENSHVWVILGAPGSGKTTLLQNLALTFAKGDNAKHLLPNYIPILIFLREHVAEICSDEVPLLSTLIESMIKRQKRQDTPPIGWFEKQLLRGHCLILLDGIDEVASEPMRKRVSTWIDKQVTRYAGSRFIISARPDGYQSAPLQNASVIAVQPFGSEQVKKFVHCWYIATEIMANGNQDDAGIRRDATQGAADFMERLAKRPGLTALTINPLLLTMIVTVHRYRGALPGRRVELYDEICEVLLGHWNASKNLITPLAAAQHRAIIQPLAYHMMKSKIRDIPLEDAQPIVEEIFKTVSSENPSASSYFANIQSGSGLLIEREAGVWCFAHLTFQEYLAACHMREMLIDQEIPNIVGEPWWHETLRLYAAKGDGSTLVRHCLDKGSLQALTLASECLEEARSISPNVRLEAENQLVAGLDSDNPVRNRMAAEVRLSRRLRNFARIDDNRTIDPELITCAEYQLFLHEMYEQSKHYQPEHWSSQLFPKGSGNMPITGMGIDDAKQFCRWLNLRLKQDGYIYRLPKLDELISPSIPESKGFGVWCRHDNGKSIVFGLDPITTAKYRSIVRHNASTGFVEQDFDLPAPGSQRYTSNFLFGQALYRRLFKDHHSDGALSRSIEHYVLTTKTSLVRDQIQALHTKVSFVRGVEDEHELELEMDFPENSLLPLEKKSLMSRYKRWEYISRLMPHKTLSSIPVLALAVHTMKFSQLTEKYIEELLFILRENTNPGNHQLDFYSDLVLKLATQVGNPAAFQQTLVVMLLRLIEYSVKNEEPEPGSPRSPAWMFWKKDNRSSVDTIIKHINIDIYVYTLMMKLRADGALPAWEAIRLVCEKDKSHI